MTQTRILIVEDEPVVALDIEESLFRLGYDVVMVADSAETALSGIAQSQPDLVLMDIHLRGEQTGIDTAMQVQQQHHLPVVFLTAHADEATLLQVKAARPFGYIVKPFEMRDLSVAIEIALSRYQSEVAMQAALQREKELNAMKSRFVSMVSHEFRSPLSSILFSLDLLETAAPPFERQQVYLGRAREAVDQLIQLLEDVLTMGETDAKQLDYQPLPLLAADFCQELIEQMHLHLDTSHSIRFTTSGLDLAHSIYLLDQKLLHHILTNLLSNAVKYSPDSSEVTLTLTYQEPYLIFQVRDQGIGIARADQSRLFDSFYRGSNVGNIPGHGLGLSIVKQCVEAHRGQIKVESQLGVGTIFTVMLQAAQPLSVQQREVYENNSGD
jgi:signal transduction histidine kinase